MLPFRIQARGACPPFGTLALGLACEFRATDVAATDAALDRLGALIAIAGGDGGEVTPDECLDACGEVLGLCEGFTATAGHDPDDLLLDTVLERRAGHPAVLAVVYIEAAGRAGIELRPVVSDRRILLAMPGAKTSGVLDPARPGAIVAPTQDARWRCSHQLAFAALNELVERYALCGDLRNATRAAELRLHLPVDEPVRERLAYEVRGLRAALN